MKKKNLLAENMLRFKAKNLSETTKRKIVKLAEIITEQSDNDDVTNLGQTLNSLNLNDGVYELDEELANVNIFTAVNIDVTTVGSDSGVFSGAYARPLYLLKNKTMFFIGQPMTGGPIAQGKQWSNEQGYKIVKPRINPNSGVVRKDTIMEEPLITNSAIEAYMQIYNFNIEGYRDNEEITKLVLLLEDNRIIPNLKEEINDDTAYTTFLQHRHDSVMKMISK